MHLVHSVLFSYLTRMRSFVAAGAERATARRQIFGRLIASCALVAVVVVADAQEPGRLPDPDLRPPVVPEFLDSATLAEAPTQDGDASPEDKDEDDPSAWRKRFEKLEKDWKKFQDAEKAKKEKAAGAPTFKMGGQIVLDALWFSQDANSRAAVGDINDELYFRRARLYASGDAFEVFSYAIGFDFAQGTGNNGRPTFIDNFIQVNELPWLQHLRIGHYFEPFSLDRVSSNRNLMFMERSLADAFAPSRNTGVMAFGESDDQAFYWAAGVFHGNSDNFGDDGGDQEGIALDGRLVWRPYYDEPSGGRYYLHLGSAYTFREAPDGVLQYRSRPEATGQGDAGIITVPFFVDTGLLAAHHAQQYGTELLWTQGSLSVQGEWIAATVDRIGGPNLFLHGGYLQAGYFLTGEHRPYNRANAVPDRVVPFENFFRVRTGDGPIVTGSGAWEVAVRWSYLDFTNKDVDGGRLNDLTLGLNWFLTPYNRTKFNYILADLDRQRRMSQTHIFALRFDMDF